MFNIITEKTEDPQKEFSGLWLNKSSGSIWIWINKPVLLGFAKDSKMISIDEFSADFVFTARENKQQYEFDFEYSKLPSLIIATVKETDYVGGDISISFGDTYGMVAGDGTWVVAQTGNAKVGENLKVSCVPTQGSTHIDLIVLSYE